MSTRSAIYSPSTLSYSRRLFHSSVTQYRKATPDKSHHHRPIPDDQFPSGYLLGSLHVGVKKAKSDAPPLDLAVLLSTTQRTSSAACFTRNVFKAAPVVVSQDVLKSTGGRARALVVNSGCANAVTGKKGMEDAWSMVNTTTKLLNSHVNGKADTPSSLVLSTGVIGQLLPIQKITSGISSTAPLLSSGFSAWEGVAKAFMTTDTFPKLRARSFGLPNGKTVRIAGIDKGAGMIHPNMGPPHGTLLGLVATDAAISPSSLQNALTYAVDRSFNSISVDGDMSTNDTIIAFANGAIGGEEIDEQTNNREFLAFREQLVQFCTELAQLVVRDGEGATKFVTVSVKGADSYEDGHKIASSVATSSLVKCALYGEDANWGRILCAVGYTPSLNSPIDPTTISVSFIPSDGSTPLALLVNGEPEQVDEVRAKEILEMEDLEILIDLKTGSNEGAEAKYYTCDLSHEYVTINGDYRS